MTLAVLEADDLAEVMRAYAKALDAHRAAINRLNVYPVPDGDTGTNMALTLRAVCAELDGGGPDGGADGASPLERACHAISHGSLMGARGNSGVILSQVLRGISGVLRQGGPADGANVAAALAAASVAAYGAVMKPVEGTILTVVREAADAAEVAGQAGEDLAGVLEAARRAGAEALERTPEQLPVLAEAGVVDAGGAGFLLLLDAALAVVDDRPIPEPPEETGPDPHTVVDLGELHDHEHGSVGELRYEVMFLLDAADEAIDGFRDAWATMGDSIVVVGGEGIWNCHIHTDDVGAAVEAGIDVGRPHQIRVTDLHEQVEEERWVREADHSPIEPAIVDEPATTAVVAVATGDGIRRIFQSLGVQRIVTGGQTMNPSTAQLLEAVESAPADAVVVLPNNKNIIPVAEQVDAATDKTVRVVPTRSVAEGFACLLDYDPEAPCEENIEAMAAAAGSVVAGEVTRAVRASSCDLGPIAEGDWLGLGRDGIVALGSELGPTAAELLDRLIQPEHELVTIIEGEGATPAATRQITVWLGEEHPAVGAEVHHGGQPLYPYLFGVE